MRHLPALNDAADSERREEYLPTIETSGGEVGSHVLPDGTRLRYATWRNRHGAPAGTVLYLNGRTEFIEKNLETVAPLLARGFDVWTLDWRGQGLSDRPLANAHKGHVADFADYVDDLQHLLQARLLDQHRGPLQMLGHSMGGHLALRTLHDNPGLFARAVLCAPMIDIYAWASIGVAATALVSPIGYLPWLSERYLPFGRDFSARNQRFEGNRLTADRQRFRRGAAYIARDPRLALGSPTMGWLAAAKRSIALTEDRAYAAAIEAPVFAVLAGDERVVDNARAAAYCRHKLPAGACCWIEGARHELLIECDPIRQRFWRAFDDFMGTTPDSDAAF